MVMNKPSLSCWDADPHSFPTPSHIQLQQKEGYWISDLPLSHTAQEDLCVSSLIYTNDDYPELIQYNANHGSCFDLEINMPDHARSWPSTFPKVIACSDSYPDYSCYYSKSRSEQLSRSLLLTYEVIQRNHGQALHLFNEQHLYFKLDKVSINCRGSVDPMIKYIKRNIPKSKERYEGTLDQLVSKQGQKTFLNWEEEPLMNCDKVHRPEKKDIVAEVLTSSHDIRIANVVGRCEVGVWPSNSIPDSYDIWQRNDWYNLVLGLSLNKAQQVIGNEALVSENANFESNLWPCTATAAKMLESRKSNNNSTVVWNVPNQMLWSTEILEGIDSDRASSSSLRALVLSLYNQCGIYNILNSASGPSLWSDHTSNEYGTHNGCCF
ncbi:hypothetical protein BCR41DRAFT_386569 [Lobosporangium transversale]|uniref:beta-N-acetylhexosaminidase n=1 Tax=Lobosporangium transversale TaxID=64571 RepID=A0A1Y2GM57_9FUNG|nr:hypothetical protein BCR41DRAFT_386569 [Lobosporangium transversale]ORZ15429.1 hypothetical protein BCR41DRAFT_386569 [Lobosporangium transversale]|eukprot:XP_021881177.1 hypothetical protein BCR41DRAFT_386569 [Lobosporangium transversale]